ncbi:hypothetical protein LTR78_002721 [Recurvomyces mirabilis]|uniref:Uncharacterized protein n=1 Tax=Recurvomyces mirabilis TaxID=574656 RepID=A0AAE1C460_9PEZI|nr:hypothetical protein LTR78_002721 [Recurvomyces mirabilis]KAK5159545.1 hypothetical protein LTS14_002687 [Recurvomyces mirabilis]
MTRPCNGLRRRTKRDYLTEALRNGGKNGLTWRPPIAKKRDISHWNVARRVGWRKYTVNKQRHAADQPWPLSHSSEPLLERIVASYIQETPRLSDPLQASWHASYQITTKDHQHLRSRGWQLNDLKEWSQILSQSDVSTAATRLAERVRSRGPSRVPIMLLTKLLRRPYINAPALRTLLSVSWEMLLYRSSLCQIYTSDNTVFVIFLRLLRHARVVWPTAIENIADLLLQNLPSIRAGYKKDYKTPARLTHMLNAALRLITIRTAVEPMHNTEPQEAAVVRILSFMSEQHPQLQITREGFRAVIRIQLTMKKTPREQEWGKLKALSWPPWKQDRTAMDALITPEYGVTRALSTLGGMREAGYGFLAWENSAQLLAGWDVDRTPTIQSRMLLGSGWGTHNGQEAENWAARIIATRTAQEAWAAYLAYEESEVPAHELVHLAILEKLYREEKRQKEEMVKTSTSRKKRRSPLMPGDTREVEPLPPSTHLYTYTSRPVPTVQSFFVQLRGQGHRLRGHALSFAVAHAKSLEQGIEYLLSVQDIEPAISSLLSAIPDVRIREVPDYLFASYIQLLCHFTNAPLSRMYDELPFEIPAFMHDVRILSGWSSHRQPVVFALHLLQLRGTLYRPAWIAVLHALNRSMVARGLHSHRAIQRNAMLLTGDGNVRICHGHIIAYRLAQRTVSMLEQINVDLDIAGLHSLCINVNNLTWNCWHTLNHGGSTQPLDEREGADQRLLLAEAMDILRTRKHTVWLKHHFWRLVGESATYPPNLRHRSTSHVPMQPRFLNTPGPAVIHAYVRALGWAGDYDGILEVVRWMVEHESVLKHARERDRNGEDMLRLSLIAARGFMERAWLVSDTPRTAPEHKDEQSSKDVLPAFPPETEEEGVPHILRVMQTPAPIEIIAEVRELVESVEAWQGWATDAEVEEYFADRRFRELLDTTASKN